MRPVAVKAITHAWSLVQIRWWGTLTLLARPAGLLLVHGPRRRLLTTAAGLPLLLIAGCTTAPAHIRERVRSAAQPAHVVVERVGEQGWQLRVNGEPYVVRGVVYEPTLVGREPDQAASLWVDWAHMDLNGNGLADAPYDAWVDVDSDGTQGAEEEPVGDFALMQAMGVNTIRWYHNAYAGWVANKDILRDLYLTYGIRVAVGDLFGAYPAALGYEWNPGTDYRNAHHRATLLQSVERMVREHKDEPYTLLWLLGNGNNWAYSRTNAALEPEAYATLLQEAAVLIHQLDPHHPVVLVNEDLGLLVHYAERAPAVDIFGVNLTRGLENLDSLWAAVRKALNRPVLVTAYGSNAAPAYHAGEQMYRHQQYWQAIEQQLLAAGPGNALGGFAADWLDAWWRTGLPDHQAQPATAHFFNGETVLSAVEWGGLWGQGDGRASPFLRQPRLVYCLYQSQWNPGQPWLAWCDQALPPEDVVALRKQRQRRLE
jgi:beta-glucuronidase